MEIIKNILLWCKKLIFCVLRSSKFQIMQHYLISEASKINLKFDLSLSLDFSDLIRNILDLLNSSKKLIAKIIPKKDKLENWFGFALFFILHQCGEGIKNPPRLQWSCAVFQKIYWRWLCSSYSYTSNVYFQIIIIVAVRFIIIIIFFRSSLSFSYNENWRWNGLFSQISHIFPNVWVNRLW